MVLGLILFTIGLLILAAFVAVLLFKINGIGFVSVYKNVLSQ